MLSRTRVMTKLGLIGRLRHGLSEKRQYARASYTTPVTFTVGGAEHRGLSQNNSAGGALIKTDESFTVGEPIVLLLPFRDGKEQMSLQGAIARIAEDGIGVEFLK
jgi:hypothetical protein